MNLCESCQYFSPVNTEGGQCRFEPPKVMMIPIRSVQGDGIQPAGIFPPVRRTDGCGKHAPQSLNG